MLERLIMGGFMMIPLGICSIVMVAVLIERFIAFHRNSRIDTRALRAKVRTLVAEDRLNEAVTICANTPSPVAAVLMVGLQTYQRSLAMGVSREMQRLMMEKAMDDYTPQALHVVELRLNWLATISNVAPLFGMTGTVTGMIRSFGSLAGAGSLDAGVVGAGISEALIATASGLVLALCSLIPYNSFMNSVARVNLAIGEAASDLVQTVAMRAERGTRQ